MVCMNIQDTLKERGKTHGNFTDNARVSQELKTIIRSAPSYHLTTDVEREALDMILHKIGRAVCGNPHHDDVWHDISGYATLVEERLL